MPAGPNGLVRAVEWFNWLSSAVHAVAVRMVWRAVFFSNDPATHPAIVSKGHEHLAQCPRVDRATLEGLRLLLNAVPIRMLHDRWIDKYLEREVSALLALKPRSSKRSAGLNRIRQPVQVYKLYFKAKPQAIWDAFAKPEWSERYGYDGRVSYELKAGGRYHHEATAEMKAMGMPEKMNVGEPSRAIRPANWCRHGIRISVPRWSRRRPRG